MTVLLSASLILFPLPQRPECLPPDPKGTRTQLCSQSSCASWHSETSGRPPPLLQISSLQRRPAVQEAAAAPGAGGVLLTCSWRWDLGQVARPLPLPVLPEAWFCLAAPLRGTGSFTAGSSEPLALPQIHAALTGSVPRQGENGWLRGSVEFFEEKNNFFLLSGNAHLLEGAKRLQQPNWREYARKTSKLWEPALIKAVFSGGFSDPRPAFTSCLY